MLTPLPIRRVRPARVALVGAAAGALLLAGAPAAVAAPALVVPLDPPDVTVLLVPTENLGDLEAPAEEWTPSAVTVQWGGSVVVELPEPLDAGATPLVTLEVGHEDDPEPLRTYSSDPAATDPLAVTSLGGGGYEVALPTDDGVSGDVAVLTVEDVVAEAAGDVEVWPVSYFLRFDDAAGETRTLVPQMLALSFPSCSLTASEGECAPYRVTAGDSLELTAPAGSRLRALGFGTLTDVRADLQSLDDLYWSAEEPPVVDEPTDAAEPLDAEDGAVLVAAVAEAEAPRLAAALLAGSEEPAGVDDGGDGGVDDGDDGGDGGVPAFAAAATAPVLALAESATEVEVEAEAEVEADAGEGTVGIAASVLEPVSLPVESTQPHRATLSVPADTTPGPHLLVLTEGDPETGDAAVTMLLLEVTAAPPAPVTEAPVTAPPAVNAGLRSNTGAESVAPAEPVSGGSATVAIGAALLLLSGVGGIVAGRGGGGGGGGGPRPRGGGGGRPAGGAP
ncbi:hypothetical protein ACI79D_24160, partial [Geodermatophilus sp. SYSU D00708]